MNVNKLQVNRIKNLDLARGSFSFILEKTKNGGFSSFTVNLFFLKYLIKITLMKNSHFVIKANEKNQDFCSLIQKAKYKQKEKDNTVPNNFENIEQYLLNSLEQDDLNRHKYSMIIFHLDLVKLKANIIRVGKEMKTLEILPHFKSNIGLIDDEDIFSDILTNNTVEKTVDSKPALSKLKLKRETRNNLKIGQQVNTRDYDSPIIDHLDLKYSNETNTISFKFQVNIKSSNEEGLYLLNFFNCFESDLLDKLNNGDLSSSYTKTNQSKQQLPTKNRINSQDKYYLSDFNVYYGGDDFENKFSINLDVSKVLLFYY
jgi:hypothetical protein